MPGFNNTIHATTIYGQIYSLSIKDSQSNFVITTMNNNSMLKRIRRFDLQVGVKRGFR